MLRRTGFIPLKTHMLRRIRCIPLDELVVFQRPWDASRERERERESCNTYNLVITHSYNTYSRPRAIIETHKINKVNKQTTANNIETHLMNIHIFI